MNNRCSSRIKILFINYRQMLEILTGRTHIVNIPDHTKIIDINQVSSWRRGFEILIEHPSFPEKPEGEEPELFYSMCEESNKIGRKLHFD